MFKKIIFNLFLFFSMIPVLVYASEGSLAKVGNKYYDSLEEAIANASGTETIMLISDVELDDTLLINKTVNINLNGNDITAPSKVFEVEGGFLTITGKGTVKETEPNYGAIMVKGKNEPTNETYTGVSIGKDVTLEGWSGIFINHKSSKAYGVNINFDGKINAINDTAGGTGIGIYVNGNIANKENAPVVNISDTAQITSTGNGIYIAGNSTFNIKKADISGAESGIGIKSGTLNINGATVAGTGKDATPTEGYNNGIKASGTAIQIESNNGYPGDMNININSGTFKSKNSNVIYEYIGKGTDTQVNSINLKGGTYISDANKDALSFSNSFKSKHPNFISGGKYSSNPTPYLKSGYTTSLNNDLYSVTESVMKEVTSDNVETNQKTNYIPIIITLITTIILASLVYINRIKILNFLSKWPK